MRLQHWRWLSFTVLPALIPFCWLSWKLCLIHSFSVEQVFGKGELLLACSAFGATGLGDLIASGKRDVGLKFAAAGGCLASVMLSVGNYVDIGVWLREGVSYDISLYARGSVGLCLFTLICGASCIRLAGYK